MCLLFSRQNVPRVQAEKEAKRLEKAAKPAAKRAAALPALATPAAPRVTTAAHTGGLPVAYAVPMPTPVQMPNLTCAALEVELGVGIE